MRLAILIYAWIRFHHEKFGIKIENILLNFKLHKK